MRAKPNGVLGDIKMVLRHMAGYPDLDLLRTPAGVGLFALACWRFGAVTL